MTDESPERDAGDGDLLREAVAFCVVSMIRADGRTEPAERDHARAALARCILFAESSVEADRALLDRMDGLVERDPDGAAAHYGAVLRDSPWRYTALAIMADIMASDGQLADAEFAVLANAAAIFDATEHDLEAVVENVKTEALEDLITGENLDAIHGLIAMRHADPPAD